MPKERANNKIRELMSTAMKDLNSLVDVNTVVGKPVTIEDGTLVIPITKVTLGFMTGGGEYGEIKQIKKGKDAPFAGGSGAVVSLKPSGFLVDQGCGVQFVNADSDPLTKLVDCVNNFIKSLKNEEDI